MDRSRLDDANADKKLSYQVYNPIFHWDKPSTKQDMLVKQIFVNNSKETHETEFSREDKTIDTFSWSITEGIKLGFSVTAKMDINIEVVTAGVETGRTFEFELSSTQGASKTEERSWIVNQRITNGPQTTTEVDWLLDRNKAKGTFTANIIISGWVAMWFHDKIDLRDPNGTNRHWLWFITPGTVVRVVNPAGFVASGSQAIYTATGTIEADVGLESRLVVNETPLQLKAPGIPSVSTKTEYRIGRDGRAIYDVCESGD